MNNCRRHLGGKNRIFFNVGNSKILGKLYIYFNECNWKGLPFARILKNLL